MRGEEEIAERERMKSFFDDIRKVYRVALRLRYFGVIYLQMRPMHPEAGKGAFPRSGFRLGDLVVVVDTDVLDAAGMDVYLLAENGIYHRRAFDVPAGETFSPRRIPPQAVGRFPEDEIGRIAFLGIRLDARALTLSFESDIPKLAVVGKAKGVEIHAAETAIRVPFFFERFYHRYLRGDVVASEGEGYLGDVNIQFREVVLEYTRVLFSHLAHVVQGRREAVALEAFYHLVVALIRIGGQMPEIGEIDDLLHFIGVEFEGSAEYVGEDEHRKIPDVLDAVDRGAAVVHPRGLCIRGEAECLLRLRQRIVEVQWSRVGLFAFEERRKPHFSIVRLKADLEKSPTG